MLEVKFISSMEKCFLDQTPDEFAEVKKLRMYKNERASVQFLAYNGEEANLASWFYLPRWEGGLSPYIKGRMVENVPNYMAAYATPKLVREADPGYLRTTPGLYPDVLMPLTRNGCIVMLHQQLRATFFDIELPADIASGSYPMTLRLIGGGGEVVAEASLDIEVIDAVLPEEETRVTQWFYADALCDYYGVEAFSDRHFAICENFIKTAVKNGINMILTPVFTPPLDTAVGGERTTTQLLGVKRTKGRYSFDFSLLDRFIDMLNRCGVKYIEISHLFTQWGGKAAPKIMATVDGEYKRLFGWETDASGKEYVRFLRTFLKRLIAHLQKRGDAERTYFHISDEPSPEHLEQYKTNRKNVRDLLEGQKIFDALSHIDFYNQGLCDIPVPSIGSKEMRDFLKADVPERWVYYCCGPLYKATNRFIALPSPRTRSLGMQMYKYDIEGFLHWGYNFYNNQRSLDFCNPFLNPTAGYWGTGGDAFSVYPAQDGTALESIRLRAFHQGLTDIRVMKLCESFYGKKKVVEEIEKICGEIYFDHCVDDVATMQRIRDRLDDMIMKKLS